MWLSVHIRLCCTAVNHRENVSLNPEGTVPPNPIIVALRSYKGIMAVLTVYIPALILVHFCQNLRCFVLFWQACFGLFNVFCLCCFLKAGKKVTKEVLVPLRCKNRTNNMANSACSRSTG